jgi:hypothetical protein
MRSWVLLRKRSRGSAATTTTQHTDRGLVTAAVTLDSEWREDGW